MITRGCRISCSQSKIIQSLARCLAAGAAIRLSLVWDNEETGLRCKARIDRFAEFTDLYDGGRKVTAHVDLKTTGQFDRFNTAATELGYFLQAAHYLDGCEAVDKMQARRPVNRRFLFVVADTTPHKHLPEKHRVKVFEYDESEVREILPMRNDLLRKYQRFMAGEFPGDPPTIKDLFIPKKYREGYGSYDI